MLTRRLKEDMIADEVAVRIQPAEAALQLVRKARRWKYFRYRLEPLIIQMLAREPANVIDFR